MGRAIASIIIAAAVAQPAVPANEEEVLTNEDVLVMSEAGLAERVIVAKIMASETDFDISREELVALSSAGVGASVLEAMVKKTVPSAGPDATTTYAQRFEGTPCPASGLYVEDEQGELRGIDPQVPQIRRGNTVLPAVTGGIIPAKAAAAVRGATSDTRIRSRAPTFWFCPSDLEYSANPAGMVDPREFVLVVLKASKNREERSVDVGSAGITGQTGVPPRLIRRAKFENVGFGVYRITPRSSLKPGEYGFFHPGGRSGDRGASGSPKMYAFGVDRR